MPISTKVSGAFRSVKKVSVKLDFVWRNCPKVFVKVAGVWEEVFSGVKPFSVPDMVVKQSGVTSAGLFDEFVVSNDGTKIIAHDFSAQLFREYSLSTPFNLGTRSQIRTRDSGAGFTPDARQAFCLNASKNRIFQGQQTLPLARVERAIATFSLSSYGSADILSTGSDPAGRPESMNLYPARNEVWQANNASGVRILSMPNENGYNEATVGSVVSITDDFVGSCYAVFIEPDGLRGHTLSGSFGNKIVTFTMSTPFDLSTVTKGTAENFFWTAGLNNSNVKCIALPTDGLNYIIYDTESGNWAHVGFE